MLYKAAIDEEKDVRPQNGMLDLLRIEEIFLDLLRTSMSLKSMPMPTLQDSGVFIDDSNNVTLGVPLQDDEPKGESLFSGKTFRIDTDVRFTPHLSEVLGGDTREFFGKVKAGVSIDFLDPLLHRRYLSTEIETWHKPNGDSAVFMNFVIWGK